LVEKLLNIEEASAFLFLSVKEVEELVGEGKIPAFHLDGKYLRFRRADLAAFRSAAAKSKEDPIEQYSFWDGLHDFFYFNDFYFLSIFLIFLILYVIIKT
jgi:excisionase family DNA binding protein